MGIKKKRYINPSYLGDLILSLNSDSRNLQLGLALGRGISLNEFEQKNPQMNIEGINTIKELYKYTKNSEQYPLINFLYSVLYEQRAFSINISDLAIHSFIF